MVRVIHYSQIWRLGSIGQGFVAYKGRNDMNIGNYLTICDPFKYALIFKSSRPMLLEQNCRRIFEVNPLGTSGQKQPEESSSTRIGIEQ
jgi:hypothetical protein